MDLSFRKKQGNQLVSIILHRIQAENYRSFFIIMEEPLVKVRTVCYCWATPQDIELMKGSVLNECILIARPFRMLFMKFMLMRGAPRKPWFGRENWDQLHFGFVVLRVKLSLNWPFMSKLPVDDSKEIKLFFVPWFRLLMANHQKKQFWLHVCIDKLRSGHELSTVNLCKESPSISAPNSTWKWNKERMWSEKNRYKPSAFNKNSRRFLSTSFMRLLLPFCVFTMKIENEEKTSLELEAGESERFLIRVDRK